MPNKLQHMSRPHPPSISGDSPDQTCQTRPDQTTTLFRPDIPLPSCQIHSPKMQSELQSSFERVEQALQRLTDSIAAYNPSTTAAEELAAADDAVTADLKRRTQHQIMNKQTKTAMLTLSSSNAPTQLRAPRRPARPLLRPRRRYQGQDPRARRHAQGAAEYPRL